MSANTATVEGTTRGTLLVVDGHSLAFRAFFALPVENFSTSSGQATNAVWGFATMLSQVIDAEHPDHLAVAFDVKGGTFRNQMLPQYKGTRDAAPEELLSQLPLIQQMLTAFSQSDLVKKATGAGAMAYVTKPYEESKLLPALEVAMGRFAEINDLLDNVERSESKLHETEEQLKKAEETLEERKLVDRAKGLLMDKADFSEQGAFRWIQKTSMDQRIPKKRLAMAIIAKYGDQKSEAEDER